MLTSVSHFQKKMQTTRASECVKKGNKSPGQHMVQFSFLVPLWFCISSTCAGTGGAELLEQTTGCVPTRAFP